MAVRQVSRSPQSSTPQPPKGFRSFFEKFAAIAGGIALFLGLFILFAGDQHTIGFWDQSWQVGEISEWWGVGLTIAGAGLVLGFIGSVFARRR